MMPRLDTMFCAVCVAGKCGHADCKDARYAWIARTLVAGTAACNDCTPRLLELVMHPLRVVPAPPELRQ